MHIQVTIISRLKATLSEAKGKERWRKRETSLSPSRTGPVVYPEQSGRKTLRGKNTLSWKMWKVSWMKPALWRESYSFRKAVAAPDRPAGCGEFSSWCSFRLDRSYHSTVVSWLFWGFAHNCSCLVQSSFLGHDTPSTCVFLNVRLKLAKAGGHLDVKRDYVVESGSHQVVAMWPKFTSSIV